MPARNFVVILGESSAEQRAHSERRKEAAGNPLRLRDFSLSIHHRVDAPASGKSANPGNSLAPRAQLLEENIGEATLFFVVLRNASPLEEEQLFWIFDRQHFEQHGVHQAEDRRICADAKSQ